MKKLLLSFIFFVNTVFVLGQSYPILTDQLIVPSKKQSTKMFTEYQVGNIILYNSDAKNYDSFYIVDQQTGKRIYEYEESEEKARHLKPKFFMTEGNNNLIILCMSLEGNYSWGTHIFIIDHDNVSYSGLIRYGADNFNFSGLGQYSQFEQHGDWFIMFFQEDVNLINYETDDLVSGGDIEFKIEKDKISLLEK